MTVSAVPPTSVDSNAADIAEEDNWFEEQPPGFLYILNSNETSPSECFQTIAVQDHVTVLGFFHALLQNVRQQAGITRARAQKVVGACKIANDAARLSEDDAIRDFLACAESRYIRYLDICATWLQTNPGRSLDEAGMLVPPWDVAVVLHAHLLSPLRFRTDISKKWPQIWKNGFGFPLESLSALIRKRIWSDTVSEAFWNKLNPHSPYQLRNTLLVGEDEVQPSCTTLCGFCGKSVKASFRTFSDYRIRGCNLRCSFCNASLKYGSFCDSRIRQDPRTILHETILNVPIETPNPTLLSRGLDLNENNPYSHYQAFRDLNHTTWPLFTIVAPDAESSSCGGISRKHPIFRTEVCERHRSTIPCPFTVDLVDRILTQESIFSTFSQFQTRSSLMKIVTNGQLSYVAFMKSLSSSSFHLGIAKDPSLETTVFWLTHQLFPKAYNSWCAKFIGKKIDHSIYLTTKSTWIVDSLKSDNVALAQVEHVEYEPGQQHGIVAPDYDEFRDDEYYELINRIGIMKHGNNLLRSFFSEILSSEAKNPDFTQFYRRIERINTALQDDGTDRTERRSKIYIRETLCDSAVDRVHARIYWFLLSEALNSGEVTADSFAILYDTLLGLEFLNEPLLDDRRCELPEWILHLRKRKAIYDQIMRRMIDDMNGWLRPILEKVLEDEAAAAPPTSCDVCMEDNLPPEIFPYEKISEDCDHKPSVCLECLGRCLEEQLYVKSWSSMTCPICSAALDSNAVEKWATEKTTATFHRFMIAEANKDDPCFRSCLRPNCPGVQIHEQGDAEPIIVCILCGYKMCFVHERAWHEGETCQEFDDAPMRRAQQLEEKDASESFISQNFQQCPGPGCKARIEKNSGCDHISCSSCRYEFCWRCLADFSVIRRLGNEGHRSSCPYNSKNLPPMALLNPRRYL